LPAFVFGWESVRKRGCDLCKTFSEEFLVDFLEKTSCGKEKNVKRFGEMGCVLKTRGKNLIFYVKIFLFKGEKEKRKKFC
jgi:hypothetical protein